MDEKEAVVREIMPTLPEGARWVEGPRLEQSWESWWRGALGTYKDHLPHNPSDERVGSQETRRLTGTVLGRHPDLGTVRYAAEMPPLTDIDRTQQMPAVFFN